MFKRLGSHSDSMLLALVVWLCSLPLVLLLVAPLLGLKAAGLLALVLFFVVLAICWVYAVGKLVKIEFIDLIAVTLKGGDSSW